MKKSRILWLVLMMICCLNIYGQQKEITSQEFYAARIEPLKKVDGYNRRVTYKREVFQISDGSLVSSYTSISEVILPNKTRFLSIQKDGDATKKFESVKIGYFEYRRVDDGEWTKIDLRNSTGIGRGSGIGSGIGGGNIKITNKYTVAEDALNGQQTLFYQGLRTIEFSTTYKTFSQDEYWISREGLILKSEIKTGFLNPERIETQAVTEYEYNPKDLKIEAPIK